MRVAIAGGHGQIALRLAKILSERGDEVVALIRNPDHAEDVRNAGAKPAVVDLEYANANDVAAAIDGVDAVVFAAGAGPGSGSARKDSMDYGGAVLLVEAAKQAGICRYVIVSSMGADPEFPGDDTFTVYQRGRTAPSALPEICRPCEPSSSTSRAWAAAFTRFPRSNRGAGGGGRERGPSY
jgi:nucleoside-diphosphate-sugar epimerase